MEEETDWEFALYHQRTPGKNREKVEQLLKYALDRFDIDLPLHGEELSEEEISDAVDCHEDYVEEQGSKINGVVFKEQNWAFRPEFSDSNWIEDCITGNDPRPDTQHIVLPTAGELPTGTIVELLNTGHTVHLARSELEIHADTPEARTAIRALPPADNDDVVDIEYRGGRPPRGFDVEDGELVKNDQWDTIARTLQRYAAGDTSRERAAEIIGCTPTTVENAVQDRPRAYGINPADVEPAEEE